ncbi:MAG: extracellular solute-binding protein [Spirochaetaceae bacterium]|jgi:ABC-type glycerol-3-phosphate transport system substrate-binding protein|nr:extracellular solute-binding protein [Spirochaetaceae bacterium]
MVYSNRRNGRLAVAGLVAIGLLALIAFTACNKSQSSAADGKKLVVYTHQTHLILGDEKKDASGNTYRDPSTAWQKILTERFTEETGIEVEFVGYGSDSNVIKQLLQVRDPGLDLFSVGFTMTNAEYDRYMAPIMTVAEAEAIYGKDFVAAMPQVNGTLRQLNIAKEYGEGLTYNEDVIKAAGYDAIPGTIGEFEKMLQKIKDSGKTPISLHRVENWPMFVLSNVASYVGGRADSFVKMLDDPEPFSPEYPVGKTIKMYTEWKSKGFFEQEVYPDFGIAMDSVAQGKAGMLFFGTWVIQQVISRVPQGASPDVIKFDAPPDFGNGRYILVNNAQPYAINAGTKHLEEAKQYLDFLARSPEYLAQIGCIATHKDVKPIAPAQFALIQERVERGEVQQMIIPPLTQNSIDNDEILKDANLLADHKWAGLPFDALDITRPNDWNAYNAQIKRQNDLYNQFRKERGASYKN